MIMRLLCDAGVVRTLPIDLSYESFIPTPRRIDLTNIHGGPDQAEHHPACPEADDYKCPRFQCRKETVEDSEGGIIGDIYVHDILSYDSEDIDRTEECPEDHDCKCEDIFYDMQADAADDAREMRLHG